MDRDLVESAQHGDQAAFVDLIRARLDRLYATAHRILRDVDRAEDALQDALVIAWRDLRGLRDPDRFDAWLYRLVVRECIDQGPADVPTIVGPQRDVGHPIPRVVGDEHHLEEPREECPPPAISSSSDVAAVFPSGTHPLPTANAVTLVGRTWERQIARVAPCPPETVAIRGAGTDWRRSMSLRKLVALAAIVAALTAFAPSVAASSAKPFHLEKTCVSNVLCTITWTDFEAIAPGTDVTYTWDATRPWLAYPTIVVRNGSTTGVCNWDQPGPTVLAICSFSSGTGRLTQFHLVVDVSVDTDNVWHWDGTYWYGPGH